MKDDINKIAFNFLINNTTRYNNIKNKNNK